MILKTGRFGLSLYLYSMKTFLLTTCYLIASLFAFGQKDSLLRTDGIYIFDNGLDTIMAAPKAVMDLAYQLLKDQKIKDWRSGPCGFHETIPSDSSTYLHAIAFFSENTCRIAPIGSCRDEQYIRNVALQLLSRQAVCDTSPLNRSNLVEGLHLKADSSIYFTHFKEGCPAENYWGNTKRDALFLEMNRASNPGFELFNSKRKYIFYSYKEIFDCDWIYIKPPPVMKD